MKDRSSRQLGTVLTISCFLSLGNTIHERISSDRHAGAGHAGAAALEIREGKPFPLGATWDGLGVNFALFSANATKVELCLFDDSGETELERIELPEYTDEVGTAICRPPAPAPFTAIASTAVRAGGRTPLQSQQAADRSLCEAAGRPAALGSGTVRLQDGPRRQGQVVRRTRQRAVDAKMPGHRPGLHLGRLAQAGDILGAHDLLRNARQGLYQTSSAGSGSRPRHLCRPGQSEHPGLFCVRWASPAPSCCRSTPSSTTAISSTRD